MLRTDLRRPVKTSLLRPRVGQTGRRGTSRRVNPAGSARRRGNPARLEAGRPRQPAATRPTAAALRLHARFRRQDRRRGRSTAAGRSPATPRTGAPHTAPRGRTRTAAGHPADRSRPGSRRARRLGPADTTGLDRLPCEVLPASTGLSNRLASTDSTLGRAFACRHRPVHQVRFNRYGENRIRSLRQQQAGGRQRQDVFTGVLPPRYVWRSPDSPPRPGQGDRRTSSRRCACLTPNVRRGAPRAAALR